MTRNGSGRPPFLGGQTVIAAGPVHLSVGDRNSHPALTIIAILGVPATLFLAIYGLPPIDVHGPLHYLGVMGPTCGVTRGVMWFTRGEFATAWAYNPISLLMVPAAVILLGRAIYGWSTGRWFNLTVSRSRWLAVLIVVGIVALTIRQQLNIDLLA